MSITSDVESVLRDFPHTRDSDKRLIMAVYWNFHQGAFMQDERGEWGIKSSKFFDLPSSDSITRARRKLQEQGKYEPTCEEVKEARRRNAGLMRGTMPTEGWRITLDQDIA